MARPDSKPSSKKRYQGGVLSVARELLSEGQSDAVIDLLAKTLREVETLKRLLAEKPIRRKKGEGISSTQLKLLLDTVDDTVTSNDGDKDRASEALRQIGDEAVREGEKRRKRRKKKTPRHRHPIPENLRHIETLNRVPDEERACPVCGEERTCIGHDRSYTIDIIPAEAVVLVDVREKLACKHCEGELVRAPRQDTKVVSGGKLGSRLVSQIVVDKYRDGLPLHRIKRRLSEMGLDLAVSTLADQVTWVATLLRPLWRASMVMVLNAAVMQLDGTGIAVREPRKKNLRKMGTLWGYIGDQTAVYLYASTGKKNGQRPGELGPEDMLRLRSGYTVADASQLFDESFKRDDLIECGCNMHARRYFKKALDSGDKRAALVLGAFKALYQIEERIKDKPLNERLTIRQAESAPIYDKISEWCKLHKNSEPPSSAMGAAIRYLTNHEEALRRFLEHGLVPMDNGAIERAHIRVALTRKNYLFAGSDEGAERAAIVYSILASCQLAEVDPVEYLADILPRLAGRIRLRDVPELLPAAWKAARS